MLGCNIAAIFSKKIRTMMRGHRDTWRILRKQIGNEKYVWFHAASLGEFEQGRPLMERLRREHPEFTTRHTAKCTKIRSFSKSRGSILYQVRILAQLH